jgi:hypothetical protein
MLNQMSQENKLGFAAYVLHTRHNSVVTVGAFDGMDDPKLKMVQQQLARLSFRDKATGLSVQEQLKMFAQPMPMEVPRP